MIPQHTALPLFDPHSVALPLFSFSVIFLINVGPIIQLSELAQNLLLYCSLAKSAPDQVNMTPV